MDGGYYISYEMGEQGQQRSESEISIIFSSDTVEAPTFEASVRWNYSYEYPWDESDYEETIQDSEQHVQEKKENASTIKASDLRLHPGGMMLLGGINAYRRDSLFHFQPFIDNIKAVSPSNPNNYLRIKNSKEVYGDSLMRAIVKMDEFDGQLRQVNYEAWQNEWVRGFIDDSKKLLYLKIAYMDLIVKGCYHGDQSYLTEADSYYQIIVRVYDVLDNEWHRMFGDY